MIRVAAGDSAAFRQIVQQHRDAAWRAIRVRVRDDATADDALQETFLGAWRGAGAWRGDAPLRTWILGLARRQAARTWRSMPRTDVPEDPEKMSAAAGFGAIDPETHAAALEDADRLYQALETLPPEDREVLALRDLEQIPAAEVAEQLGLSLAATKSRLHRARLRLMAALGAGGAK